MSETANTMVFFSSRVHNIAPQEYVGDVGRMFYYPDSGTLRLSDGSTPGGLPINLTGNISDLAFGNFLFSNTTMTVTTADADLVIEGNGTGNIDLLPGEQVNIAGALHVHADGNLNAAPRFDIASTGDVTILAPVSGYTSGVNIIGSSTGTESPPQNTGVMIHITGQDADPSRIYNDGNGDYAAYIGRRYNGTVNSPAGLIDGDIVSRVGSTPTLNTGGWPEISTARIDFVQHGNATTTNYGSQIEIWTTRLNSTSISRAAYFNGDTFYANNITSTGLVNITSLGAAGNVSVLNVTNNVDGQTKPVLVGNVVAHFTGKDNTAPLTVFDGFGNVAGAAAGAHILFRSARGNLATPTAVQNNDRLGRISGGGWGDTGYGSTSAAVIDLLAAGTFTDSSRPGKIVLSAVPSLSTSLSPIVTFTPNQTTFADNHLVANAWINIPAGTISQAPLQFAPGVLPTTSTPGALDYNGTAFYGVPSDLQIGVIPTQQQFVLNGTHNLTQGSTALQSIFGKSVSLSADTRYYYKITLKIAKQGPQASVIYFALGLSAGLTLTNHRYRVDSSVTNADNGITATYSTSQYKTTGFDTAAAVTPAMTTTNPDYAMVTVEGYIGTGVAGTLTPQISFNPAPVTSISIQPLSSMWIYPIASATGNVSIGTWA